MENGNQSYFLSGHENKIEIIKFVNNQKAISNIYHSDYVQKFNKGLANNLEEDKIKEEEGEFKESNKNQTLTDLNQILIDKAKQGSISV